MLPIVLVYLVQGLQFSECITDIDKVIQQIYNYSNNSTNIVGLHNGNVSRSRVDVQSGCGS